jgi:hypothetical protein
MSLNPDATDSVKTFYLLENRSKFSYATQIASAFLLNNLFVIQMNSVLESP